MKMIGGKGFCLTILGMTVLAPASLGFTAPAADKPANARMLIQTISEEKTEIQALAAQQARLKQMGGSENTKLAAMWGRWIREHKAASPMLMKLTKDNGGDPNQAKILKPPVLGSTVEMVHATHMDHVDAVKTSQMRYAATNDPAIKKAMNKRANLARKHIMQMKPHHDKLMRENMGAG